MKTLTQPDFGLDTDHRQTAADILQGSLHNLIALALHLKQAHWNLNGPNFRSVHEQLDEIEAAVRGYADDVAERIVTLGFPADGRPQAVAQHNRLTPMDSGFMDDTSVVEALTADLANTVRQAREPLARLGEVDPISEDLMIGLLGEVEKHAWMLRAQIER